MSISYDVNLYIRCVSLSLSLSLSPSLSPLSLSQYIYIYIYIYIYFIEQYRHVSSTYFCRYMPFPAAELILQCPAGIGWWNSHNCFLCTFCPILGHHQRCAYCKSDVTFASALPLCLLFVLVLPIYIYIYICVCVCVCVCAHILCMYEYIYICDFTNIDHP